MVRPTIIVTATSALFVLVAFSELASAQVPASLQCRKTETQAECHTRLKCKPDEELEACQKRRAAEQQSSGNQRDDERSGREARDDEQSGRERESRDRGGRDDGGDRGGRERSYRDDDGGRRGGGGGGGRRGRRGGGGGGGGGGGFEANKTFGLGLELGEPTGLNGKYFFGPSTAFDFGVGWIYRHYYYGDGIHLYGDVLFHPVSLVHADGFELPLYIGVGVRFWDFDYCVNRVCTYGGNAIGIRVPVGISFDFNTVPLDIFIQAVPTLDFLRGDYYDRYRDRSHFGVDFSVGLRYWFK